MTITFFGHSDVIRFDRVLLKNLLTDLIENQNATLFYVGNQGGFDRVVLTILKELKCIYPHIQYYIVLAYIPVKSGEYDCLNTVYPDGLENVPKRFAICKRNDWMIKQADTVPARQT